MQGIIDTINVNSTLMAAEDVEGLSAGKRAALQERFRTVGQLPGGGLEAGWAAFARRGY